tara:strand:- start:3441 stop:4112 length:672 start_codon:yes stop_codon:yes gene_type:complete
MVNFKVFFRTSKSFGKKSISGFTDVMCMDSLLKSFDISDIHVIIDNGTEAQENYYNSNGFSYEKTNFGNCKSFLYQVDLAEKCNADIIYFVEHDHYHLDKQKEYLQDGLELFDVVSLYDHPDKYSNPLYKDLLVQMVMGKLCHWRNTPSTVMTFAFKKKTLEKIKSIITNNKFLGSHLKTPEDHAMFIEMWKTGISLGTCIPGRTTHLEEQDLSPYVDWMFYK